MDLQHDALAKAGCARIFDDKASGAATDRHGLSGALAALEPGDTLAVWRLDRLGRSLGHLIRTVEDLRERGVAFRSLSEGFDTATSGGKLVFHIFGALAAFERELIRERTMAGLAAAAARGRHGGRPRALTTKQLAHARVLLALGSASVKEVAATLGVSRSTLHRTLATPDPATLDRGTAELRQVFATRTAAESRPLAI